MESDSAPKEITTTEAISTKQLAIAKGLFRVRRPRSGSPQSHLRRQKIQYLLALDFESTCWEEKEGRSPEIIEFPVVLCSTSDGYEMTSTEYGTDETDTSIEKEIGAAHSRKGSHPLVLSSSLKDRPRVSSLAHSFSCEADTIDASSSKSANISSSFALNSSSAPPPPPPFKILERFHEYVIPLENPSLSSFCVSLTGISQHLLDSEAVPLHICLQRFWKWLRAMKVKYGLRFPGEPEGSAAKEKGVPAAKEKGVPAAADAAFLTWTSWDLGCLLPNECKRKNLRRARLPAFTFLNLRQRK